MPKRSNPVTAQRRAALVAAGQTIGTHGRLSAVQIAEADALLSGEPMTTIPADAAAPDTAPPAPPGAPAAEQSPRDVRAPSAGRRAAQSLWGRRGTARGRGRGRGRARSRARQRADEPWLPTAGVIEHLWSQAAWAARGFPPVQRILSAQAPMAGVTLQAATRGTWVDAAVLQPAARWSERWDAAAAMVGPPVMVGAIMMAGGIKMQEVEQDGETISVPVMVPVIDRQTGRPVMANGQPVVEPVWDDRTRVMIGGLRFSLMSWLRVGRRHAAEIVEQAEQLAQLGDEADELIRWILAPPQPGQQPGDVTDQAGALVADFMRAGADAARDSGAPVYPDPQPSATPWANAFSPSAATGASGTAE